jgi:hypothetical protein
MVRGTCSPNGTAGRMDDRSAPPFDCDRSRRGKFASAPLNVPLPIAAEIDRWPALHGLGVAKRVGAGNMMMVADHGRRCEPGASGGAATAGIFGLRCGSRSSAAASPSCCSAILSSWALTIESDALRAFSVKTEAIVRCWLAEKITDRTHPVRSGAPRSRRPSKIGPQPWPSDARPNVGRHSPPRGAGRHALDGESFQKSL